MFNENITLYNWDDTNCGLVLKEKINIGETMMAAPLLTRNNDLIVATAKGKLIKLDTISGVKIFELQIDGPIFNSPAEGFQNEEFLIMNVKGQLTRINKEGSVTGRSKVSKWTCFAPMKNGLISDEIGNIYRIENNEENPKISLFSKRKKKIVKELQQFGSFFIVLSTDGVLEILDQDGNCSGSWNFGAECWSSIGALLKNDDFYVFIGSRDDQLTCLRLFTKNSQE